MRVKNTPLVQIRQISRSLCVENEKLKLGCFAISGVALLLLFINLSKATCYNYLKI